MRTSWAFLGVVLYLLALAASVEGFAVWGTSNNNNNLRQQQQSGSNEAVFPSRSRGYSRSIISGPLKLSPDETTTSSSASVRFSGSDDDDSLNGSGGVISWILSDTGSIILGSVGIILVLLGRLVFSDDSTFSSEAMGEETRVNLLSVLACGSVLLNGLSKLDVTTALAETVDLVGNRITEPVLWLDSASKEDDVNWLLQAILKATPAETVALVERSNDQWCVVGYTGTVPTRLLASTGQQAPLTLATTSTPILDRFADGTVQQESYLPTLQALPGKTEFGLYLPSNTQSVLLVPMIIPNDPQRKWVLVCGGNQARSFTPRDIAWTQTACQRI